MKKSIILSILILTGIAVFSQPVSKTELRTAALNFYKSVTKDKPEKKNAKIKKLIINKLNGVKTYAVAVFDNNDWIAMSTDKRLKPILAHSIENSWSDSIAPGAKYWFDIYDHYVYNAKVNSTIPQADIEKNYPLVWNNLITGNINNSKEIIVVVPPLLTTKWGFGGANSGGDHYAYNYYMPPAFDEQGNYCEHAISCCVAIAMAQILRYWKYPSCSVFDWDNMPNELDTSATFYDTQKKQIANLYINISELINVHYGCDVSLASVSDAYTVLKNTFKFNDAIQVWRTDNNHFYYDSILCDNLNNHLPIFYSGCGEQNNCHAFVCDGWELVNNTDTLFHFNYGWYGSQSGYYFDLNGTDLGYYLNQKAIINLYPTYIETCNEDSIAIYQYYRNTYSNLYYNPRARIIYSSPEPITIASNETVIYTASDEIVLENFETETGADFTAVVNACVDCSVFFDSTATDLNNKRLNNFSVTQNTEVKIYPNPSAGIYTVSLSNYYENSEVYIYDCFGELTMKIRPVNIKFQIDLSDKLSGIYLIKIITKENIYQQKIIKL
jgi:hypothetical protein